MSEVPLTAQLEILKKENQILQHKLKLSIEHRQELEEMMEQNRALLETVSAERLTEEKKKQLEIFSKFVPKEFLESLSKESTLDIALGDYVEREMTVLFSDIFAFTTLSESMTPGDNFKFVNGYLKHVEPPIHLHHGFIDKFIGDAIMALFNTPDDAIKASIDMQKALGEYNLARSKAAFSSIKMGIGLHTGTLMLGIIGVQERMQSTVISDAVNLASRLEGLTRQYQSSLIISSSTLSKIHKEEYNTRFLGKMQVVGKKNVIEVFEILNAEPSDIAEKKLEAKPAFEEGLELYFAKSFAEGSVKFTAALKAFPEDKAGQLYLRRCANYMVSGVPEDWNGIEVVETK